MKYPKINLLSGIILSCMMCLFSSCEEESKTKAIQPAAAEDAVSSNGIMKLNGEIISIPSPVLVVSLLQKNSIAYNATLSNPVSSKSKYVNETKKALNLGLYGADLAYTGSFNAGQSVNDYVDAVAGLANDLGILEKIDRSLVSKLTTNISNKDSLVKLNAELFKLSDRYLRDNQQNHLSSYILIGGWIEALYLSVDAAKSNQAIASRIGEQKYSAPSIQRLATQLNDQSFAGIKEQLNELCAMLLELESTYKYEKPINDRDTKTTYLMSKTSVNLTVEELAAISEQVEKVRNLIIE